MSTISIQNELPKNKFAWTNALFMYTYSICNVTHVRD